MPRPKAAATVPDVLDEIRAFRAKRDGMIDQVRKRRTQAEAVIAECDQALAELGAAVERAVAALVPNPALAPSTPRQPKAAPASRAPEAKGVRAGDPVAAELAELLAWIGALKSDRQRQAIRLRASGMSPAAVAAKLGCSNKDVGNDIARGRKAMREARSKGKPAETPASDDEPAPAPVNRAFADLHPRAPQIARELLERRAPANDIPRPATVGKRSEPQKTIPENIPRGWDRSDPDEDFTDLAPAVTPADPAHIHLWSPESGGSPACTLAYDPAARLADRGETTCPSCLAIPEPAAPAASDQRPPDWVLGWLSPEVRRAYQGVALEGLSCQTMAWSEAVTPNVISGRVNGARQKVNRLMRWEAEREAEGVPLTDKDREAPPAYREAVDPLLAILRRPESDGACTAAADPVESLVSGQGEPTTAPDVLMSSLRPEARRLTEKVNGQMRSRTLSAARLSRAERRAADDLDYPEVDRPRTRGDCANMPRPCPFVSCSHHLFLDVNPETGALKLNFPHLEVDQMAASCSLDVADRGGITLEEVGAILNLTRERIRQVEVRALDAIRDRDDFEEAPDHRGSPLAEAISGG